MNDQPSPLGQNDDDRSTSPKRKKVRQKYAPKACVSCRRSKLKCSGDNPCQRCRDNNKRCFFSEDQTAAEALQNLSRPSISQQPSLSTSASNGSMARRNIMPRHQAAERRVSNASALGLSMEARMVRVEAMMEALLQERSMTMTPSRSMDRDDSGNNVAMLPLLDPVNPALALMDQGSQITQPHNEVTSSIDPTLSTDTTGLRFGNRSLAFPTPVVYHTYIDVFFRELQPFHPCIEEHSFHMRSERMFATGCVEADDVCFLGLNYIIFALQDISTGANLPAGNSTPSGYRWLQLADDVVGTRQLHGQGDLSLAQFLLFKALYYCLADQPGFAYTTIGLASRYVVHHSLHRQSSYIRSTPEENSGRLRTFWTVLITDRRIALSCGRPYSIRDIDVDVQLPVMVFKQDPPLSTHLEYVFDKTKSEIGFLECMVHWSRFAASLWDSLFAATAAPPLDPESVSTFDETVEDFFQNTYTTIPMDLGQTRQIQYIHLSFNNLRLLARRQIVLSLHFDGTIGHSSSELVSDILDRVRDYEAAPEPPYSLRHCLIPSLAGSLVILCALLVRDPSLPNLGLDVWTPTYISNFGITVTMLHDLAERIPLAQRVLVDFDRVIRIVQTTNATWSDSVGSLEPAYRRDAVSSQIPPNVQELFPYRDLVPIMQTTQITTERRPSGVIFSGSFGDHSDPWVAGLASEEVGRGVLWV